jgi:hypothetical protein
MEAHARLVCAPVFKMCGLEVFSTGARECAGLSVPGSLDGACVIRLEAR